MTEMSKLHYILDLIIQVLSVWNNNQCFQISLRYHIFFMAENNSNVHFGKLSYFMCKPW